MIRQLVDNEDLLKEARQLDNEFMKESFRADLIMPTGKEKHKICYLNLFVDNGQELVYVCGNSLGPQPKGFSEIVQAESEIWAKQ